MMQQTYGLYRTADAGAHWTVVAVRVAIGGLPPPGTPGLPVKAARAAHFRSALGTYAGPLAVVNGMIAYLGGPSPADNTVALGVATGDGGRTWRRQYPGPAAAASPGHGEKPQGTPGYSPEGNEHAQRRDATSSAPARGNHTMKVATPSGCEESLSVPPVSNGRASHPLAAAA
jgi:hypothetical protein